MKTAVIIPSRYASTRLPGKPLLEIGGKAMILRVLEQAQKSQADFVAVATDDERIFELIKESGGEVFMTREDHPSGSDRIAEVAEQIDANFIVNVQGDEPFISPSVIDELVLALQESGADIATMCTTIKDAALVTDPNAVKVVCTDQGDALYFSRAPIPFDRHQKGHSELSFLHLGIYAYRRDALLKLSQMPPHPLEKREGLEQLRALAAGMRIRVLKTNDVARGIDTPEDLVWANEQVALIGD